MTPNDHDCVKYIKIPSPTNFSPFSFFISH